MAVDTRKYDALFKAAADKYDFGPKHTMVLKGIVQVESFWNPRAYRFEPEFFKTLKAKESYWADKDPSIVSASYGLSQILFTTAWSLGMKPSNWKKMSHAEFEQVAERIYDPATNLMLQAQLVRVLVDKVWADAVPAKFDHLSALDVALARYNGGSYKNPDDAGVLDEQRYVDKVWRAVADIEAKEAK